MSNLVAYYEDEPVKTKDKVEVQQRPLPTTPVPVTDGVLRPGVVYVLVRTPVGPPLHVPFATYDEWSLRDRYNEALRIVNTLGASSIECQSFAESKRNLGVNISIFGKSQGGSAGLKAKKVVNSGFDYSHTGVGSAPRDPRPLKWPDEPGFAAAVVSVLDNKATRVVININVSQKYSRSGSLGKSLQKVGFELGVSSDDSKVSRLHITAEFPAGRKAWL